MSQHQPNRDKALLDRIKTREELEKRGMKQVKCPHCEGTGININHSGHKCIYCEGDGYNWEGALC